MQQAIATVIADVGLVISQGTIRVKQGDSKARAVNIVLRSNGSRYTLDNGVTVKLHGKPTADTDILIDCTVIGTDTAQAVLTSAMVAVVGITDYEAQIYGADGERLSTAKITIEVIASNDISGVTASDDFSTLTSMVSQFGDVQELTVRSEAAKDGAENAEAEATRQAGLAQGYAADANASKLAAAQSAEASAASATEGAGYTAETKQAMQDYLAMLGVDVATLVGGKVPMSQIPATATQEIYDITSEDELTGLIAQRGDCAEIVETIDGVKTVTKIYQLLGDGDATVRDNWVVWGTSYAVQAGNATSATNAVNASMINNHRMVAMTQEQYDQAAVDQDTIYIVDPPTGGAS